MDAEVLLSPWKELPQQQSRAGRLCFAAELSGSSWSRGSLLDPLLCLLADPQPRASASAHLLLGVISPSDTAVPMWGGMQRANLLSPIKTPKHK